MCHICKKQKTLQELTEETSSYSNNFPHKDIALNVALWVPVRVIPQKNNTGLSITLFRTGLLQSNKKRLS